MDKVETFKGVVLLDAAVEVDTAVLARVSKDDGVRVDDVELALVGSHLEVVLWDDANDGKKAALGLPALGASAGVVVQDVAFNGDLDGVSGAVASEDASSEVLLALGKAIVNEWV